MVHRHFLDYTDGAISAASELWKTAPENLGWRPSLVVAPDTRILAACNFNAERLQKAGTERELASFSSATSIVYCFRSRLSMCTMMPDASKTRSKNLALRDHNTLVE